MTETTGTPAVETIKTAIEDILKTIDQEREREIITRRFGLYERRETLEQIGELLGITRERVRQLEKAILARLKTAAADGKIPAISDAERLIIRDLSENGRVGRVQDVANRLSKDKASNNTRAHIAFIGELSPRFVIINETDNYHQGISIAENGNEKKIRGLASLSKKLANLKDVWGLAKWPTVNPKNIRDKIYVILAGNGKPMHFSDISKAIKESDFKRRNVTTQAIHNELIKDKRFVLIGRGIYALDSWGYSKGTVSDIIADILRKAGEPLHRDEIVRRVLKSRQVKETTILLNLQSKSMFKRVAKATYTIAEPQQ